MTSEVSIANGALSKIGADPITDLTEGTRNAIAINLRYTDLRDLMSRGHPWNFAMQRTKLSQSAITPVVRWEFQFRVPPDYMRTHIVSGSDLGFQDIAYQLGTDAVDGQVIMTNFEDTWLTYITKITDPNLMPADFRDALSFLIASEIAMSITQSNTIRRDMEVGYRLALAEAKSTDGIEDFPERLPEGSWVRVRNGGRGGYFGH